MLRKSKRMLSVILALVMLLTHSQAVLGSVREVLDSSSSLSDSFLFMYDVDELTLVDSYGVIAPYDGIVPFERIDYAEVRLEGLLTRKSAGEFDSFTAEEQYIVMEHLGMIDEPMSVEER